MITGTPGAHAVSARTAPLSLGQRRLWTLQQIDPANPAYHLLAAVRLQGPLDVLALQASFQYLVQRHDSLRTRFLTTGGDPVARIEPVMPVVLERLDQRRIQDAQLRAQTIQRIARQRARAPFDLEHGPLLRLSLLDIAPDEHVLLVCIHHLVCDGWSLALIIEEIASHYSNYLSGAPADLTPPHYGMQQYVQESLARLDTQRHIQAIAYWERQLEGVQWSRLPTDFAAPAERAREGRTARYTFGGLGNTLKIACRAANLTRYQFLMGVLTVLLARMTRSRDVAVATLLANRRTQAQQRVIGFLANTFVFRQQVDDGASLNQLLRSGAATLQQAIHNGDVSLHTLASRVPELANNGPAILFSLQNNPLPPFTLGDVNFEMMDVDHGVTRFPLSLYVAESEDRLDVWLEYDTGLYHPRTVDDLIHQYMALVRQVCEANRDEVLVRDLEIQATAPDHAAGQPLGPNIPALGVELIQRLLREPDEIVLVIAGRTYRTRDLAAGVAAAAEQLLRLGCRAGDRVVLQGDRSFRQICALWAAILCGVAYIPVSRELPAAKLDLLVENARPHHVLGDDLLETETAACAHDTLEALLAALPGLPPELPAYIIYTSGTTGAPKGVTVSRANLAAFFAAMEREIAVEPGDSWLAVSSIGFDIAALELLWPLATGCQVTVLDVRRLYEKDFAAATHSRRSRAPLDLGLSFFASADHYSPEEHRALLTAAAIWADGHRVSTLWTPERHFGSFGGGFPNPALTSAHLCGITQRVAIRAGSVVSPLHNTVRLAEDWALLSRMSGGRVGVCLAAGWNPQDFVLAARTREERHEALRDQIEELRDLWSGRPLACADAAGRYFPTTLALRPRVPLPLGLTVSNRREQFRFAARHRLPVLTHLLEQNAAQLAENLALYRGTWRACHGEPDGSARVTLMIHTFVTEEEATAQELALGPLIRYLQASGEALSALLDKREWRQLSQDLDETARMDLLRRAALDLIRERSLICGKAAAVQRLHELSLMGVDEVACLIDFGIEPARVLESLESLESAAHAYAQPAAAPVSHVLLGPAPAPTHLQCTPSLARILLRHPGFAPILETLKVWLVGGESLSPVLARSVQRASNALLLNVYGPTETTIWACLARIPRHPDSISIGQPLPGTQLHILDDHLRKVPRGAVGELYIGGEGVAQGYWSNPALTAASFIPDPFQGRGARLYRTGDLARLTVCGEVEFLGRQDSQIKLDGHRVELRGIEALLESCPEVSQATVAAFAADGEPLRHRLEVVAFVVLQESAPVSWCDNITKHLTGHLEPASFPRHIIPLQSIPLTRNEKTDWRRLEQLYRARRAGEEAGSIPGSQDPLPPGLSELLRIWSQVLGHTLGARDNFFALGGNSLQALQIVADSNRWFGAAMPLQEFYRDPSPAGHFTRVGARDQLAIAPTRVQRGAARYAVSFAQRAMLFMAQLQEQGNVAYHDHVVLRLSGPLSVQTLEQAFARLVRRHAILHTAYHYEDDEYYQVPLPHAPCDFRHRPLEPLAGMTREQCLIQQVHAFATQPFDLLQGQVLRALVLQESGESAYLCLVFHHIVCDGSSLQLALRELLEEYQRALAGEPERPPAPWQYIDYSHWQRQHLLARRTRLLSFWRHYCEGLRPSRLLWEPPTSPDQSSATQWMPVHVPDPIAARITNLARTQGVSLFAVLSAALCIELEQDCACSDLCIAIDAANREQPEFQDTLGMMVNQLLVRTRVPAEGPLSAFLREQHSNIAAVLSHQSLPYDHLVRELNPARRSTGDTLFDVKLVLNEGISGALPGLDCRIEEIPMPALRAKFPLLINLRREPQRLQGAITFDGSRFARPWVEEFWGRFMFLLEHLDEVACVDRLRHELRAQTQERGANTQRQDADRLRELLLEARRVSNSGTIHRTSPPGGPD